MSQKYKHYPIEIDGSAMLSIADKMERIGLDFVYYNTFGLVKGVGPTPDVMFEERVKKLLGQIERRAKTGSIVLHALPKGQTLRIVPYTDADVKSMKAVCNAYADPNDQGTIHIDPTKWVPVSWACTGPGKDPWNGTSGTRGDELLLHEMIHSMRMLNGRFDNSTTLNVAPYQYYTDTEEFIAILITNIFISEQGIKNLRRDHSNGYLMPLNWLTSAGFLSDPVNRQWTEYYFFREPIAMTLATALPASVEFNPFRQVYLESAKALRTATRDLLGAIGM